MSRDIYHRDEGEYGLVQIGKPAKKDAEASDTYTPIPVKILDKRHEAPGVYTFRLAWKIDYLPGQFIQCSILGCGECPISFSGWSPDHVEITIKEEGRVSTQLCALKKGDVMHVRGPYGRGYPMQHFTNNDIIITGAGTGVAPLRGVISYLAAHRENYGNIHLFFGFHAPEDVLFKDEILEWECAFNLCLAISHAPRGYHGVLGHCTDALAQSRLNNTNKIAIVCGPTMMINQTVGLYKSLGFNEDQIFVSQERHMKCATGVCGHCMIRGKYCCKDGPVFRYDELGTPDE